MTKQNAVKGFLQELRNIHPSYRQTTIRALQHRINEAFTLHLDEEDFFSNMLEQRLVGYLVGFADGQGINLEELLVQISNIKDRGI